MRGSRWFRPISVGLAVLAVVAVLGSFWLSVLDAPLVAADAYTYLAAGERLNSGSSLYALSAGDRWVWINPPYWTVPLLSPPPIAVIWRPLAALPSESGVVVWQVLTAGSVIFTVALLMRGALIRTSLLVILLAVPIGFELDVANVNSLLLLGYVGAWYLFRSGRDAALGSLVALMTSVKLAPIILAWWLLTQRRFTAVRWFVAAGLVIAVISVLGAGFDSHVTYLGIAGQTSAVGTSDLSLAGIARSLGLEAVIARWLPLSFLAVGIVSIGLLRRRPGPAFAVAILTLIFGSPVINFNTLALCLAAIAPLAMPLRRPGHDQLQPLSRFRFQLPTLGSGPVGE